MMNGNPNPNPIPGPNGNANPIPLPNPNGNANPNPIPNLIPVPNENANPIAGPNGNANPIPNPNQPNLPQQHPSLGNLSETYYPKSLARFSTKRDFTLTKLATDAFLKVLTSSAQLTSKNTRNARSMKLLRQFMDSSMPLEVQNLVVERAVGRWLGSEKCIRIMEVFEPRRILQFAYGCYYQGPKLFWSNGTIERLNLNTSECDRLFNILLFSKPPSKPSLLRTIALSTERQALSSSKLPNIIARSHLLHSVTVLNGASNHLLRILGINCPNLCFLDVSHSQLVTDFGVKSLLKKYPKNSAKLEKNKCADRLSRLIVIGTGISDEGLEFACRNMDIAYSISFLPDTMVYRPPYQLKLKANNNSANLAANLTRGLSFKHIDASVQTLWDLKLGDQATRQVDIVRRRLIDNSTELKHHIDSYEDSVLNKTRLFIRPEESYICQAVVGIQFGHITELILTWDTFTWTIRLSSLSRLPELTELGVSLPSLQKLRARIQGTWDRGTKLFPQLKETYIWSVSDATILSFLQFCPSIQLLRFNCLALQSMMGIRNPNLVLNDENFKRALGQNLQLLKSLVEVCIRPANRLTVDSVKFLIMYCPKLKRLGDLESWNVSAAQIKAFNKALDRANSKCILTVLSFPPGNEPEFLL